MVIGCIVERMDVDQADGYTDEKLRYALDFMTRSGHIPPILNSFALVA
jgi:hypothetical protein